MGVEVGVEMGVEAENAAGGALRFDDRRVLAEAGASPSAMAGGAGKKED